MGYECRGVVIEEKESAKDNTSQDVHCGKVIDVYFKQRHEFTLKEKHACASLIVWFTRFCRCI